jgi:hypothetical protein
VVNRFFNPNEVVGEYLAPPAIGINTITALESGLGST